MVYLVWQSFIIIQDFIAAGRYPSVAELNKLNLPFTSRAGNRQDLFFCFYFMFFHQDAPVSPINSNEIDNVSIDYRKLGASGVE
jgi:hypothetical protein